MKKVIIFLVFLIFAILVFNNFLRTTGFIILKSDESEAVGVKNIIVEQIAPMKVIIKVDGVVDILKEGDEKEINGVKIHVLEVFYVEEKEERFVKLTLKAGIFCGNEICEENEGNCCIDCGCERGYKCVNNRCEKDLDKCKRKRDCDDDDPDTIDSCIGDPKKCVNRRVLQCTENKECDDQNECTKDECRDNECFNTKIVDCIQKEEPSREKEVGLSKEKPGFLGILFNKILHILGL